MARPAAEPAWCTGGVSPGHLADRARQDRGDVGGHAASGSVVIGGGEWQVGGHARDNRTNTWASGWMDVLKAGSPDENRGSGAPIDYRAQVGRVAVTTPTEDSP